jgi:hypothetical protein
MKRDYIFSVSGVVWLDFGSLDFPLQWSPVFLTSPMRQVHRYGLVIQSYCADLTAIA